MLTPQKNHPLVLRHFPCIFTVLALMLAIGCTSSKDNDQTKNPSGKNGTDQVPKVVEPVVEKPEPDEVWNKLVAETETLLEEDQLDEVQKRLDQFAPIYAEPEQPSPEQQQQLADLKSKLAAKQKTLVDTQRAADLAEAEKMLGIGKLVDAATKLSRVLASSPTEEQREAVRAMNVEIERRRRARRELKFWVQLLESEKRSDVQTAQTNLLKQPDIAMGMMIEAAENVDKPILAANAIEVLRLLNRPDVTLPAMVAVLQRSEQQIIWPAAVREIGKVGRPGAGEPLLKLVFAASSAEQRIAAMSALSQVVDPPSQTLVVLLPLLEKENGTVLMTLLQTVYRAMTVHNQYDLTSLRGIDGPLNDQQRQQLAAMPELLDKIIKAPAKDPADAATVQAAKVLAYATRQLAVAPLTGVKVLRAEAEEADGPASAVLDGVWNKVELNTMWRHPIAKPSTITLDLGETRTVVGVRIWNFNQTSGSQRGWKSVDIFVSDSPAEPTPIANGIVPRAPGVADTPDYGSTVPVPFVRGRYVRLQAESLWTRDAHTGLSEIQILGF